MGLHYFVRELRPVLLHYLRDNLRTRPSNVKVNCVFQKRRFLSESGRFAIQIIDEYRANITRFRPTGRNYIVYFDYFDFEEYRGTSLIRNDPPPRTTAGPWA